MEEENEVREAAIAASPALQPNFQSPGIKQDQLDKLKELRRRRLQIKARPKIQKHFKGGTSGAGKRHDKKLNIKDIQDEKAAVTEVSAVFPAKGKDEVAPSSPVKKRQKLHWGLDTKERWERKANM